MQKVVVHYSRILFNSEDIESAEALEYTTNLGFKIWARNGVSGTLYDFNVYQGDVTNSKSELGLSTMSSYMSLFSTYS